MEKVRGDGYELLLGRFQVDTGGKFFTRRTITIGIISPGESQSPQHRSLRRLGCAGAWASLPRLGFAKQGWTRRSLRSVQPGAL